MSSLQHVADLDFHTDAAPARAQSAWSRWLGRIMGPARNRVRHGRAGRLPVYRITRLQEDRWMVERPGASMEHAFPDLEQALALVRHECLHKPATVELRVDDLYVVAQLDPDKPGSLFGEAVS